LPDDDAISAEVRKFIREHIRSVAQLEVLLLCHRTNSQTWTAAQIADELRTNVAMSAAALSELSFRGLVAMTDFERQAYAYQPTDRTKARAIDQLAALYPSFRHRIIELIFGRERDDILEFADAFKLKKE
jgi:hypothetical protein